MSLAADIPGIGHNGGPPLEDAPEKRPPKAERIVTEADAQAFKVILTMLAARSRIAKWKIVEKRKGGEDGRVIRCIAIGYMRGLGFPVWKLEMMWDLNRKQIGQEEEAFICICAIPKIQRAVDNLEDLLDAALRVDMDFVPEAANEIDNILAQRRTKKKAAKAAKVEAETAPKPKPKPLTEADRLVADGARKRKLEAIEKRIAIAKAVIIKGAAPKASKEAKADALSEAKGLDKLVKERDALLKPARRIALAS